MGYRLAGVLTLAACSFNPQRVSDTPDASSSPPVCEGDVCTLRLDTEADLADAVALFDAVVERDVTGNPAGAVITPAAYVRGSLVARGSTEAHGSFATGVDWAAIDAATVSGVALGGTDLPRTNNQSPSQVNAGEIQTWTYWVEGEIELPPGVTELELFGDDVASIQLAPANTRMFTTIVNAKFDDNPRPVGTFDAGPGGWFVFRAAVVQTNGGGSGMEIRVRPAGGTFAPLPRARMRGRVEGLRGVFVTAWDDLRHSGPALTSLYTRPLLDDDIDNPLAPGLTNGDQLTQRWFGQFRALAPGSYTLSTSSDDGNRMFLANQASQDRFEDNGPAIDTSVTATLRAGWNDLVIDYSEAGQDQRIDTRVTAAPAGIATDTTIPTDQLRPVFARRRGVVTRFEIVDQAIPNNTTNGLVRTFDLDAMPGETVREVRVAYQINNHGALQEIDVRLTHGGKTVLVRDENGNGADRFHRLDNFAGDPLAGPWELAVADDRGAQDGDLGTWSLTVFTQGGPSSIAERGEWISSVKDLAPMGTVSELLGTTVKLEQPAGASLELYLRTCAEPAACAAADWVQVTPGMEPAGVVPARYAQLRAVLLSNGDDEPALDLVELQYRVTP